jgi:hypothetical protein
MPYQTEKTPDETQSIPGSPPFVGEIRNTAPFDEEATLSSRSPVGSPELFDQGKTDWILELCVSKHQKFIPIYFKTSTTPAETFLRKFCSIVLTRL